MIASYKFINTIKGRQENLYLLNFGHETAKWTIHSRKTQELNSILRKSFVEVKETIKFSLKK